MRPPPLIFPQVLIEASSDVPLVMHKIMCYILGVQHKDTAFFRDNQKED